MKNKKMYECEICKNIIENDDEIVELIWGNANYVNNGILDIKPSGASQFVHEDCFEME